MNKRRKLDILKEKVANTQPELNKLHGEIQHLTSENQKLKENLVYIKKRLLNTKDVISDLIRDKCNI